MRAQAGDFANLDINARNVIASGTTTDIRATRTANSSDSDIALTTSNYDTTQPVGSGVTITAAGTGTNQTAAPVFADAGYHQAATSPTIDKGSTDASVGTADLDGQPRQYGAAVDIGVDEFVPDTTPPDVVFDRTPKRKIHKRKTIFTFHASEPSTFTCVLDKHAPMACSSPFKVKLKQRGKHTLTVIARDGSGNVDPTPATYTWKVKKKKHGHKPHHHRS